MASVRVVLRKKKNKDNTFPLAIRITKDRKTSFIHLGHHIKESDWNADNQRVRKSHPNSARLNNYLLAKLAEANDQALTLETDKPNVTSRTVKQKIKPTGGATFFAQAKIYLENLQKAGNYNVYNSDKSRIKHFQEFLNGADIAFNDIDVTVIKKFILYLKTVHTTVRKKNLKEGDKQAEKPKPISERTITNHLITIRTLLNQAIDAKIADRKNYPFGGKEGISLTFPDSSKIGLSIEEVKMLEILDLSDSPMEDHARNIWLLSFYFAGVRTGDVLLLKHTDFHDGRLYYVMNKNGKGDSLKVPQKALVIVDKYKTQKYKYGLLFPELECVSDLNNQYEVQRKTSYADKKLNTYLKGVAEKAGIDKPLTMHISRHTFGNIASDKIPLPVLQKLYRHAKITTTAIYQQNHIHKEKDAALDAVIGI